MRLPAWIGAEEPRSAPLPSSGVRARETFAERTVLGISELLAAGLAERHDEGPAAALEPRARLLIAGALLLGAALTRSLVALALLSLGLAAAAGLLGLGLRRYLWRTWAVVPLFAVAIALPALLNVATPGPSLLELGATPRALVALGWPERLSVTTTGARAAGLLVLRVGASISIAALLAATTPATRLLAALRALWVPRAFVLVGALTLRFASALVLVVSEMHLALRARRVRAVDATASRAFVGSRLGVVLLRSRRDAQELHLAMVARGFRGEFPHLDETRLRGRDLVAVAVGGALAALVVLAARAGLP
ncbi:MAG: energy-coupling factor transporter transmembrane protein EcfT [Planctomycetota bacterium]